MHVQGTLCQKLGRACITWERIPSRVHSKAFRAFNGACVRMRLALCSEGTSIRKHVRKVVFYADEVGKPQSCEITGAVVLRGLVTRRRPS